MDEIGDVRSVVPAWPAVAAIFAGFAIIWPATFLLSRRVALTGDWYPTAAAASGAWLCLVLGGISAWEYVQIARGGRPRILPNEERSWRQEWRMAVVLAVGVLLGWKYFK